MPHAHCIAVAELDDWQIFSVNFDDSDVRPFVGAYHSRRKLAAIPQFHLDFVRVLDHVYVREDVAIGPHDEAGAFSLNRSRHAGIPARPVFIGRPLKKQIVEWRALADFAFLGRFNDHNPWRDRFEHFCKSVVQLMNDVLARFNCGWIQGTGIAGHSLRLRRKRNTERKAQGENGHTHRLEF